MNLRLHWLAATTGRILTTLVITAIGVPSGDALSLPFVQRRLAAPTAIAQAGEMNIPNPCQGSNITLTQGGMVIAKAKKRSSRKRVKQRRRRVIRTTPKASVTMPPTDTTEFTQAPPPPVPPAPPVPEANPVPPPVPAEPDKAPEPNPPTVTPQFSNTTQLKGEVIFGLAGAVSGDFNRNTILGHRTRLELKTKLGEGELTTRLQATGLGLPNQSGTPVTPEGSLVWTDGNTTSTVGIDALKYQFPLSPQTQLVISANAGLSDDFTDTINPYLDGDGSSGAISLFGNRPSIYYTVGGAGAGIRHKLSDSTELSVGYLARNANNASAGNGLFNGGYGALAQLTFATSEKSKIGVTYTRTFNVETGTGSTNASTLDGTSNNFGVEGTFQLNPQLALGGWIGYTQNQAVGGDRQIWSWAVTAALPDVGGAGNLAGLLVGQEPKVTSSGNGTTDTKTSIHIEGFYQMKVNDSLSITPGIIYLTAPNHDANSRSAVIGALRTTFSF